MTFWQRLRDRWNCWWAVADARDELVDLGREVSVLTDALSTAMHDLSVMTGQRDQAVADLCGLLQLRSDVVYGALFVEGGQ